MAKDKTSAIFDTDRRIRMGIWGLGRGMNFFSTCRLLNIDVVAGCDYNTHMRQRFGQSCPGARVTADENAWVVRKRDVRLPNYDCVRAHVRRAFFSLYYYSNVAIPARSFDAFACDNGSTLSLFGYKPFTSVSTVVADDDDDENSAMFALERRVLTRCPISGGEFQPFVREIQSAVRKRQFSPEEANQVKRENEKKQRLELALHMSKGPTEAWVDVPTRIANKLLGEAATKRRDELELTQSGEHGTFMPTPPKSVSPPTTKNEYEQESQE